MNFRDSRHRGERQGKVSAEVRHGEPAGAREAKIRQRWGCWMVRGRQPDRAASFSSPHLLTSSPSLSHFQYFVCFCWPVWAILKVLFKQLQQHIAIITISVSDSEVLQGKKYWKTRICCQLIDINSMDYVWRNWSLKYIFLK